MTISGFRPLLPDGGPSMFRSSRSRVAVAAFGLVVAVAVPATVVARTASPTTAVGSAPTWAMGDPTGDVVLTGERGLTRAERQSVDTTRVAIQDLHDEVQFSVDIKAVTDATRFEQTIELTFFNRRGKDVGEVTYSPSPGEKAAGGATQGGGADEQACVGLTTEVAESDESDRVSVTVPKQCVPDGRVKVGAVISTGNLDDDGKIHSRDRVTSDGLVRVRGVA